MADQYSAATVTPVSNEPKVEIKTEPRVNGYGQVSVVSVPGLQQPPYPGPSTSSGSSAMTITPHQMQQDSMEHKDAVMAQLQQQQHAQQQQQQQQQQPYWMSNREQQCCLVESGIRCVKAAGNASYSKRIQKTVAQRKLKLHMDNSARHIYICDYHKNVIQSLRNKRKRKDSEEDSGETDSEHPEVDLYQLQVSTLRRYKKQFKVPSRPGLNKAQLADNVQKHFKTIPVDEKQDVTLFIYYIKTGKSKLDQQRRDDTE